MTTSAPDAPPLRDTTAGAFIWLFFSIAACIIRAIWSEAPPAPAATTISTGLLNSQAFAGEKRTAALASSFASTAVALIDLDVRFFPGARSGLCARCFSLSALCGVPGYGVSLAGAGKSSDEQLTLTLELPALPPGSDPIVVDISPPDIAPGLCGWQSSDAERFRI
jgi:hypothetical protein